MIIADFSDYVMFLSKLFLYPQVLNLLADHLDTVKT